MSQIKYFKLGTLLLKNNLTLQGKKKKAFKKYMLVPHTHYTETDFLEVKMIAFSI